MNLHGLGVRKLSQPISGVDHQLAPWVAAYEMLIDGGGDPLELVRKCCVSSNVIPVLVLLVIRVNDSSDGREVPSGEYGHGGSSSRGPTP